MIAAARFPSVPLADDPDLAERALWNDEIVADLERMAEAGLFVVKRPGMAVCPCGLLALPRGYRCPCDEIAGDRPRDPAGDNSAAVGGHFTGGSS